MKQPADWRWRWRGCARGRCRWSCSGCWLLLTLLAAKSSVSQARKRGVPGQSPLQMMLVPSAQGLLYVGLSVGILLLQI